MYLDLSKGLKLIIEKKKKMKVLVADKFSKIQVERLLNEGFQV